MIDHGITGGPESDFEMKPSAQVHRSLPKTLICQLWNFKTLTLDLNLPAGHETTAVDEDFLSELKDLICVKLAKILRLPQQTAPAPDLFRLVQAGKNLTDACKFCADDPVHVELRGSLKGGKGGFGSLLRSVKPKAQQDDNFEACRDLSGRRLRHINNERRIREFQQRQEEEEKYVQEELKQYEANKKQLKGAIEANNYKLDDAYVKQVAQSGDEMA